MIREYDLQGTGGPAVARRRLARLPFVNVLGLGVFVCILCRRSNHVTFIQSFMSWTRCGVSLVHKETYDGTDLEKKSWTLSPVTAGAFHDRSTKKKSRNNTLHLRFRLNFAHKVIVVVILVVRISASSVESISRYGPRAIFHVCSKLQHSSNVFSSSFIELI